MTREEELARRHAIRRLEMMDAMKARMRNRPRTGARSTTPLVKNKPPAIPPGRKWLVVGGPIISIEDGKRHYVNCQQLMRLYGVSPRDCVCVEMCDPISQFKLKLAGIEKLKILSPSASGVYRLPD